MGEADAAPPATFQLIDIPAGYVPFGFWHLDPSTAQLTPETTCVDGETKTFYADAFRLMRTEVTFQLYGACVADGGCIQPDGAWAQNQNVPQYPFDASVLQKPVSLTWTTARAFCQRYGGDLPTDVEWLRAATGDAMTFGVPQITAAWQRCILGQPEPLCDSLFRAAPDADGLVPNAFTLADVGTVSWDIAPYGTMDMFGNAYEWVRTATLVPTDADFCAVADGGPDPVVSGAKEGQGNVWQLAETQGQFLRGAYSNQDDTGGQMFGPTSFPGAGPAYSGVRCAFP